MVPEWVSAREHFQWLVWFAASKHDRPAAFLLIKLSKNQKPKEKRSKGREHWIHFVNPIRATGSTAYLTIKTHPKCNPFSLLWYLFARIGRSCWTGLSGSTPEDPKERRMGPDEETMCWTCMRTDINIYMYIQSTWNQIMEIWTVLCILYTIWMWLKSYYCWWLNFGYLVELGC